jgi:hypothetical protein
MTYTFLQINPSVPANSSRWCVFSLGLINNKTTRVWFLKEQKHTSDGLWPGNQRPRPSRVCFKTIALVSRPSLVCFCSLRNHTSVVLYLTYATKTTEKQLLIAEFHTPSSPWRCVMMTLRRRSHDITSTCPTIRITSLRIPDDTDACCIWYFYTTPEYHGSIAGLHVSNFVIFLRNVSSCTLSDKLRTEGNISVHILKWFWRGIFAHISQIRSLYVGNHWSRAWDKTLF